MEGRFLAHKMTDILSVVRSRLLLYNPFYGSLAMNWKVTANKSIPTLRTNGPELQYNPEFMVSLSQAEQAGVVAHEVLHCALLHPYRRGHREPEQWNEACDYVVNLLLIDSGMTLPKNVLLDRRFAGMSAEQVYSKLASDQEKQQGSGDGGGDEGQRQEELASPDGSKSQQSGKGKGQQPTGDFVDAPFTEVEGPGQMTETDWQIAVEQAIRVSSGAGKLPAGMEVAVKQTHEVTVDWVTELKDFVTNTAPSDYTWSMPNRRHIGAGVYLPGVKRENVGRLVVAIDSSGSTSSFLNRFASEFHGILAEARPEAVVLLYCDAVVSNAGEFGPDDFPTLRAVGGGGTAFQPVFDYVEREGLDAQAIVYLTDLDNSDQLRAPSIPVLWITPEWVRKSGAFGRTVRLVG